MASEPPEKPEDPTLENASNEVQGPSRSDQDFAEPSEDAGSDDLIASIVGDQDEHSIEISAETPLPGELEDSAEHPADSAGIPETQGETPEEQAVPDEEDPSPHFQEALDALLTQMNASFETEEETAKHEPWGSPVDDEMQESTPKSAAADSPPPAGDKLSEPSVFEAAEDSGGEDASDEAALEGLLAQVDDALEEREDSLSDKVGDDLGRLVQEGPFEEEAPADVAPEPDDAVQIPEGLGGKELDAVLAGEDSEQPLDEKAFDAVIPESGGDAAADLDAPLDGAASDADEPPVPMPESSEETESFAFDPAPLEDETQDDEGGQEVGSENLAAAGTVQERGDTDEAAQEAINALLNKSAGSSAEIRAEDVRAAKPRVEAEPETPSPSEPRTRRPLLVLPRIPVGLFMKAGLSLLVGLVFGLASYVFLSNYKTRVPDLEVPAVEKTQDLAQMIQRAAALMDTGDYAGAWHLLDAPVREAPPSPLRTQAEAMRIEAAYRSLGPKPARFEAELVNSYIDTFLSHAPSHPACPDVLRWKADLYERVGLPHAAYDVYHQLMTSYEELPGKPDPLLRMGRLALEVERYEKAIEHLEHLVTEYPESPEASEGRLLLGEALAHLGRHDEGRSLLMQVAGANAHTPLGAKAYTVLGRMAIDQGDYASAINLLKRRLETGTTSQGNDEILSMLAECYQATNQLQEAQDAFRDIVRFFPDSASAPHAYIELAEILDSLGKRDDALRIASEAAQEHPENPEVLLAYAKYRELTGDSRGAAEVLLNAEEAGTREPLVLLTAGNQFLEAGYPRQAKEAFERLVDTFPGTPQAISGTVALAKLAFEESEVGRGLSMLEDLAKVTENTPQEVEVLLALGEMYKELGLRKQAGEAYRTIAAKSSEPEVLAEASMALYATGAWSEGTEVARRVDVERLSERTAFRFLVDYGHAMLRSDSQRGLELMERSFAEYPEQGTMGETESLLETYLALDQFDKAVTLVDKLAGEVQPANAEAFRKLAILCGDYAMNHQDYAAAAEVYSKVIEASDRETGLMQWAKFQRANALYAQGKTEECRSLLESVAASTSSWATDAQLKLDYMELQADLSSGAGSMSGAEG